MGTKFFLAAMTMGSYILGKNTQMLRHGLIRDGTSYNWMRYDLKPDWLKLRRGMRISLHMVKSRLNEMFNLDMWDGS